MAFIAPNEGLNKLGEQGLPATVTFNISTKTATEIGQTGTYSGGFGKATGTGYAAKTQARPTPSNGVFAFTALEWKTESNSDWPEAAKSIVASNGTEYIICIWDLASTRNLKATNTNLKVTTTLTL